jgi:hypothetical protein
MMITGSEPLPGLNAGILMLKRHLKPGLTSPPIWVDRLATSDEVRGAALCFPDPVEEYRAEILCEIIADFGGYVRLSAVEIEISLLVEEMNQGLHAEGD